MACVEKEELIAYWLESAQDDSAAMENLFSGGHYAWALFIGHLVLEKTLKAMLVKQGNEDVPRTHDLARIAAAAGLDLSEPQRDLLDEVTTFNIKARYPDYKQRFHRRATKEFASLHLDAIRGFRTWLLKML
jgi:HEPN domain-containing protein